MHQNAVSRKSNFIINLIFAIYTISCILPILLVIAISFTDEKELNVTGYNLIPRKFSTYAYEFILQDGAGILNAYGVTIFVTLVGTLLSLLVIAMLAYPLSRSVLKYRNKLSFYIFFTMLFSGGLVPSYIVYTQLLHLKDNILVMILPMLVSGFNVLILRTFFKTSIPDGIIESAKIDGAGEVRTFFSIVLPLALPGMATIALFCMIAFWNDFYLCLLYITKPKYYNLQFVMYKLQMNIQFISSLSQRSSSGGSEVLLNLPTEGARMAVAVLAIGPIVLTYPFFQRFFIQGLTIGAVKG